MKHHSAYPASTCRQCGAIAAVRPTDDEAVMECVLCGAEHVLVRLARR